MISHKPLNCITCVVKRLKSSEFRIKFRRGKIRKKRNLLSLFKFARRQCEFSSCFVTFHAIVGLEDSLCAIRSPIPISYPFLNIWTSCSYSFFYKTTSARNLPDMALEFKASSVPTKQLPLKQNTERVGYIITDFAIMRLPAWIQLYPNSVLAEFAF